MKASGPAPAASQRQTTASRRRRAGDVDAALTESRFFSSLFQKSVLTSHFSASAPRIAAGRKSDMDKDTFPKRRGPGSTSTPRRSGASASLPAAARRVIRRRCARRGNKRAADPQNCRRRAQAARGRRPAGSRARFPARGRAGPRRQDDRRGRPQGDHALPPDPRPPRPLPQGRSKKEVYDAAARERLFAKMNRIVAQLEAETRKSLRAGAAPRLEPDPATRRILT